MTQQVKSPPEMQETQETWVRFLDQEDPLEEVIATHSSILAWRIPWTKESGGLQSKGLQTAGYNWVTTHTHIQKFVSDTKGHVSQESTMICDGLRWLLGTGFISVSGKEPVESEGCHQQSCFQTIKSPFSSVEFPLIFEDHSLLLIPITPSFICHVSIFPLHCNWV